MHFIQEDIRGSIHSVVGLISCPEVSVFKTNKGFARGGCVHSKSQEHLCVIEGEIEYHYENLFGVRLILHLDVGRSITIEPNTPHYFVSKTDSIVMEWGPSMEEKQAHHERFRKEVLEHNSKVLL